MPPTDVREVLQGVAILKAPRGWVLKMERDEDFLRQYVFVCHFVSFANCYSLVGVVVHCFFNYSSLFSVEFLFVVSHVVFVF